MEKLCVSDTYCQQNTMLLSEIGSFLAQRNAINGDKLPPSNGKWLENICMKTKRVASHTHTHTQAHSIEKRKNEKLK